MSDTEFPEHKITLEEALSAIAEMVENAKAMPLSASVLMPRDELLFLVDAALDAVPVEMHQAQMMLRERHEMAEKAKFEADEIISAATAKAERLVARTEIVRQANNGAARLVQDAKEEAARQRYAAQDFIDQKLAEFEIVLEGVSRSVKAGRAKLAPTISEPFDPQHPLGSYDNVGADEETPFFDQDYS